METKNIALLLMLMLLTNYSYSQETIVAQSFESLVSDNWNYTESPTAGSFTKNKDEWDILTTLSNLTTMPTKGTNFFGGSNIDNNDNPNGNFAELSFNLVDITGYKDVSISFDYEVDSFDNKDLIDYTLTIDGNPQKMVNLVTGGPNLSTNGTAVIDIPNGSTSVSMVIRVTQKGPDYFGFDNFKVTGNITYIWTGNTNSDWDINSNWDSNAVPTAINNIIIPDTTNPPVISASSTVAVNSLTINEPDGLTINSGGALNVNGSSTGNISYSRTLPTTNWYLMSSPVINETYNSTWVLDNNIDDTNGSGNNIGIATYTTSNNSWSYVQSSSSGSFSLGTGYSIKQDVAGSIKFTGTINTQDVTKAVVSDGNAYNLVGNPYAANLSSAAFLSDNSASLESQTLWVWDQATDNYLTYVTFQDFIVVPTQGFFVKASSNTDVDFLASYQTKKSGTFKKSNNTEIKLFAFDGVNERYASIYYLPNATKGFDNGYDGETFGGIQNDFDIYSILLNDNIGKKYQVQSLPNSDYESLIVPIGVTSVAGKEITFTAEALNLPSGINVFLEDRETNTFTRLDEPNSAYKITFIENVDTTGRFYLHTKSSVLSTSEISLDDVSIFTPNKTTLRITGLSQGKANVKLFNILGKQVFNDSFTSNGLKNICLPDLSSGIYIVQLVTEVGQFNKKITIE